MVSLEQKLSQINKTQTAILDQIDKRNKKRTIDCGSCDENHQIGLLSAIQTHYYVSPSGCTEGDYWLEGELQFICPRTGVVNRLLFDNYDVPWPERNKFENNPQSQFSNKYKKLFKEVVDKYDGKEKETPWVNNHYVDNHRKKFDLVEKRTAK